VGVKRSVAEEIQQSIDVNYRWWWIYDWGAASCLLASVILSFLAGINATAEFATSPFMNSALPSLPALLITIERTLKMSGRAEWHWDMVLEYQALQRSIERKEITSEDASHHISKIEAEGDRKYPALSSMRAGSSKK